LDCGIEGSRFEFKPVRVGVNWRYSWGKTPDDFGVLTIFGATGCCHRVVPLSYKLVDDPLSLSGWWLTTTPLKNDGVSNSWDDEHSQMESHNPVMFQTTRSPYPPSYSHCSWFIAY